MCVRLICSLKLTVMSFTPPPSVPFCECVRVLSHVCGTGHCCFVQILFNALSSFPENYVYLCIYIYILSSVCEFLRTCESVHVCIYSMSVYGVQ